jgi:hypothetical protein
MLGLINSIMLIRTIESRVDGTCYWINFWVCCQIVSRTTVVYSSHYLEVSIF